MSLPTTETMPRRAYIVTIGTLVLKLNLQLNKYVCRVDITISGRTCTGTKSHAAIRSQLSLVETHFRHLLNILKRYLINVRMNESPTFSTEPNMFAGRCRRLYCSICNNYRGQIIDGQRIKLHQFPTNDQLRKKWTQRLKSVIPSIQITRKSCLCSAHFIGGVYDSMNAVPSIFILNDIERVFKHIQPLQEYHRRTTVPLFVMEQVLNLSASFAKSLFLKGRLSITQDLVPQAAVTEDSTTLEKIIKKEHNYTIPSNTDGETEFLTPDESSMSPSTSTANPSTEPYQLSKYKAITNPYMHTFGCATSMGATNPSLDPYSISPSVTTANQPSDMYSRDGSTSIGVTNQPSDMYSRDGSTSIGLENHTSDMYSGDGSTSIGVENQPSDMYSRDGSTSIGVENKPSDMYSRDGSTSIGVENQPSDMYSRDGSTSIGVENQPSDMYSRDGSTSIGVENQPSDMYSRDGSTSIGVANPSLDTYRVAPLATPTNQTPDLYSHILKRLESKSLEGGQKSDDTLNFKIRSDSTKNTSVSGSNWDYGNGPVQQKSVALPSYEQPVVIPTSSAQTYIDTADDANVYNIDFNHFFSTNEHLADLESYISDTDFGQGNSQPTRHQETTTVTSPAIAANTPLLDEAANVVSNLPQDSDFAVVAELGPYTPLISGSVPTDAPLTDAIPTRTSSKGARPQCKKSYRQEKVPMACPYCQKTLSSLLTLSRHMKVHNKNHRFVCSVCGKANSSRTNLKYHMHVHTNIKTIECTICSKKFYEPGLLKKHMKLHIGVKDVPCKYCDELFITKDQLRYHRIKVHAIGVMPVLKRIPAVCEYCGKELKSSQGLMLHYNTHDEIPKIEVCSQCGKMFANSTSLHHHISNIHVPPQQVVCHICGKSQSKSNILLHIKRCHKKNK